MNCPKCQSTDISKDGKYFRKSDSRYVQRFKCMECHKKFSTSTFQLEYNHKKRRINHLVFKLYSSGVSMNRMAWLLNVHPITIKRKVIYLACKCRLEHQKLMQELDLIEHIQIDDLITIEHTKLKPLSVSTAIDGETRLILGCQVSQIPAFGHLARISRKKYGYRESTHQIGLEKLFESIKSLVHPNALIRTDEHKMYPSFIYQYFPNCELQRFKSDRGSVTGQGELKKNAQDPLFSINHTYAMLRANINRLFRRTWCTTKDPKRLQDHLDIYTHCHNLKLLRKI